MKPLTLSALRKIKLSEALLVFDFDGTLSPIVKHPSEAGTSRSFLPLLKKLSDEGALIAVITGRSLKDVKQRLYFQPDFIAGNHGMEGLEAFSTSATRARKICRSWVKDLSRSWPSIRGISLEDKRQSLSLHYRGAKDRARAKAELYDLVSRLQPKPRVIAGKFVINLVPQGSPHKGSALKEVARMAKRKFIVFAGDDDTDEDVFREKLPLLSIRIGRKRSSRAKFFIPNQKQLKKVLQRLTMNGL